MLKNLHPNIFSLYNSMFSNNIYPHLWKTVIILSFLKPDTDPFLPVSYRPIALSSVLSKLFQKILNKRLLWFLESNDFFSPYPNRSLTPKTKLMKLHSPNPTPPLLRLLWSPWGLPSGLETLHMYEIDLRGHLPSILQSYLNNRTLIVRIQNTTSSHSLSKMASHRAKSSVFQGFEVYCL